MLKSITLNEAIQKTTKLLTQSNVKVTSQGVKAFVRRDRTGKPISVNIPVIPNEPSKDFIAALHGFVDQEVAGILYTDMPAMLGAKAKAAAEVPAHYVPRLESLTEMIERVRVEQMMAFQFEGSAANVSKAISFVLTDEVKVKIKAALEEDDREAVVKAALPLWFRAAGGNAHVGLFIKDFGLDFIATTLTASFPTIEERMDNLTSSAASVELAKDIVLAWAEHDEPEEESEEGSDKDQHDDFQDEQGDEGEPDEDGEDGDDGEPDEDGDESGDDEGNKDGEGEDESGDGDKIKRGRKRSAMQEAISELPQHLRNLISDEKHRKLSLGEIAKKRGLSEAEVQKDLATARQMLAKSYRSKKAS